MPKFSATHCQRLSAAMQRRYPIALPEDVLRYEYCELLMTQREIAKKHGLERTAVASAMRRYGISPRPPYKTFSHGAGYGAFHYRVSRLRGKPQRCELCGTTDENKYYDWANQTGDYADVMDYVRMCRRCHYHFDAQRKAKA